MAYIILAVHYLTKWVRTNVVKVTNKKAMALFIFENIIAWYGVPRILIPDRSTHFLNDLIKELTTTYDIDHWKPLSPSYQWPSWTNQPSHCPYFTDYCRRSQTWLGFQTQCGLMGLSYHLSSNHETNSVCTCLWHWGYHIHRVRDPSLRIAIIVQMPISKFIRDDTLMLEGFNESQCLSVQHVKMMHRRHKIVFYKLQHTNLNWPPIC